ALAPLRKFGPPLVDRIQPMPYAGLFTLLDPANPTGRCYHSGGGGLTELTDGAIDALVDAAERLPLPFSQIALLPFHGAAARVGDGETAFPLRETHVECLLLASWEKDAVGEQPAVAEKHAQWVRQAWQALQPFASRRAYVNFL